MELQPGNSTSLNENNFTKQFNKNWINFIFLFMELARDVVWVIAVQSSI
jgi:preprotein translocase subunit SecE